MWSVQINYGFIIFNAIYIWLIYKNVYKREVSSASKQEERQKFKNRPPKRVPETRV